MIKLNFKTYSDLAIDVRKAVYKIPRDVDLIVGNPRSGMIPAYMVGAFLNLPVSTLDEYLNDIKSSVGERLLNPKSDQGGKVLIVDDSVNSGSALKIIKDRLANKKTSAEYVFFAVYATEQSKGMVDLYGSICEQPRIFQWNYFYHSILASSCFDIDGVLCVDPTPEQNDDGEKYIDFILNAKPLYIPNYKIKALVTSRLEKYRKQTEEWLKKNNVKYDELYMLDLPSKEDRIRLGTHGKFKAEIYKRLEECILFVESERNQAMEIAGIVGKPVISLHTDEFFSLVNDNEKKINNNGSVLSLEDDSECLEKKELARIITSKSFLLGNLFFRSIRSPIKIATFPINFIKILLLKNRKID
ncbi:MAG TPA: phosphoribosyl transferase [Candidatus Moranbacteria bacterium]|nr:phosphoribosyl transferase [Candidatus Moranbacteria bacterium]HCO99441.1 phosphoribosyl transferase [Candidatus Moranbacteria bacterium]